MRGPRTALLVLVVLAILAPWPFGSVHPRVAQGIAIVALLASVAVLALDRAWPALPRRLGPALLGLWLLALLQLVLLPAALHRLLAPGSAAMWHPSEPVAAAVLGSGPHPISLDPEATARWLAFTTGLVVLALLAAPALRDRRLALRTAVAVVSGAVAIAVYGLVARLVFGNKLFGFLAVPTVAPFGPFVSKNHFAGYIEIAACLAVGLAAGLADEARRGPDRLSWLDSPRSSRIVFAWGAAAVLVLVVPVSLSRAGVVSLAAGLLAFAALRVLGRPERRHGRALAVVLGALVVGTIAVALVLPSDATTRLRTLTDISGDRSSSYRLDIWRDSLRLAAASPLVGSGFGAYQEAIPRFKTVAGDHRVEHAENDSLELLAEGGLAAALLLGFAALGAIGAALRRLRDEPHRLTRGLRAGALAGVLALFVHSAFDFNLHIPSNALLFVLLAAFALAPAGNGASGAGPQQTPQGPRRSRARMLCGTVLAVATTLAVTTPWSRPRLDRVAFDRAARGSSQGLRWRSLERDTVAHLRHRPADATAWVALGWLRQPTSPAEAFSLASWGVSLDPQFEALREVAGRISGLGSPQGRPQIQPRTP